MKVFDLNLSILSQISLIRKKSVNEVLEKIKNYEFVEEHELTMMFSFHENKISFCIIEIIDEFQNLLNNSISDPQCIDFLFNFKELFYFNQLNIFVDEFNNFFNQHEKLKTNLIFINELKNQCIKFLDKDWNENVQITKWKQIFKLIRIFFHHNLKYETLQDLYHQSPFIQGNLSDQESLGDFIFVKVNQNQHKLKNEIINQNGSIIDSLDIKSKFFHTNVLVLKNNDKVLVQEVYLINFDMDYAQNKNYTLIRNKIINNYSNIDTYDRLIFQNDKRQIYHKIEISNLDLKEFSSEQFQIVDKHDLINYIFPNDLILDEGLANFLDINEEQLKQVENKNKKTVNIVEKFELTSSLILNDDRNQSEVEKLEILEKGNETIDKLLKDKMEESGNINIKNFVSQYEQIQKKLEIKNLSTQDPWLIFIGLDYTFSGNIEGEKAADFIKLEQRLSTKFMTPEEQNEISELIQKQINADRENFCQNLYKQIDKDGNRKLSKNEFENQFIILMPFVNNSDKLKITNLLGRKFKECDIDNKGQLDWEAFKLMRNQIICWFKNFLQFQTIDMRKKGSIEFKDFKEWYKRLQLPIELQHDDIKISFRYFDKRNAGCISLSQWLLTLSKFWK